MRWQWLKHKGFSLVEMLLVLVILSVIIASGTDYVIQKAQNQRIENTAMRMQSILNAGLAYYQANNQWPGVINNIENTSGPGSSSLMPTYLPSQAILSPWGTPYEMEYFDVTLCSGLPCEAPPYSYIVRVPVNPQTSSLTAPTGGQAVAEEIAGKVPFGSVYMDPRLGWEAQAYVNAPGQTLNGSVAVNFAGVYHHGACVPVPSCPQVAGTAMKPQIFVMPISVSGVSDINVAVPASNSQNLSYPLESFTAFASGPPAAIPVACPNGTAPDCSVGLVGPPPASGQYWRVCMQVVTNRGDVSQLRQDQWGSMVSMSAFTRCAESDEPSGSSFSVFTH